MKKSILVLGITLVSFSLINLNMAFKSDAASAEVNSKGLKRERANAVKQVVRTSGLSKARLAFADAREVESRYKGGAAAELLHEANNVAPLTLACGDFDEDGVADLVSGYRSPAGGLITIHRGNIDAIYPNSPEAQRRKITGEFTDSPFLSSAHAFALTETPDFLGTGDFNADGHRDVIAAARGSQAIYWLGGDGGGAVGQPRRVELAGRITVMRTGEVNRATGLAYVGVGIVGVDGPQVLLFKSREGLLQGDWETIGVPTEPTDLVLGDWDNDQQTDIAVAAGTELLIISGQHRRGSAEQATAVSQEFISRRSFPSAIISMALGNFTGYERPDLAVMTEQGSIEVLSRDEGRKQNLRSSKASVGSTPGADDPWSLKERNWRLPSGVRLLATHLIPARVSGSGRDDLIVVDSTGRRLQTLADQKVPFAAQRNSDAIVSLDLEGEPIAVLPMRLNADGIDDLVVLKSDLNQKTVKLMTIQTAGGATFTVTSTGDSGPGSLRQAILDANSNPGPDMINFNIGSGGVKTITLASELPQVTDTVTIDGTSQPGFTGTPIVEINGNNIASIVGLTLLFHSGSVVRGLVINRCATGIQLFILGNHRIEGNFIGTDVTGTIARSNGFEGVQINRSPNNIVGGPTVQARNLVSGNSTAGAVTGGIRVVNSTGNRVLGNLIGTKIDGTTALPNNSPGVLIDFFSSDNLIGGTAAGEGNTIAFNNSNGVELSRNAGPGNTISGNSILSNGALGISYTTTGVGGYVPTPNDTCDSDSGPNNLQNYPELASAISSGGGTIVVGALNSKASESFTIEFFSSAACDPRGNGEGQTYVGSTTVTTNSSCSGNFTANLPTGVPAGRFMTATATDSAGNTSEFSPCVQVTQATAQTDLQLTMTGTTTMSCNEPVFYTIILRNIGTVPATNVRMVDCLPGCLRRTTCRTSRGSCSIPGLCARSEIGTLEPGGSVTIEIRAEGPGCPPAFENTARVTADNDSNPSNDSSTVSTSITSCPVCSLEPSDGSHLVGGSHTVTVTVTDRVSGNPAPAGTPVFFSVTSGPNENRTGEATTNQNGQAQFTYQSNGVPGTDVIVVDGALNTLPLTCIARVTWVPNSIACSIDPPSATNPVGGEHTVTATVIPNSVPQAGLLVNFRVTDGPNSGVTGTCAPITCQTNGSGQVRFTYRSNGNAGTDTIEANGMVGTTPFRCTVRVTWINVPPPPTSDVIVCSNDTFRTIPVGGSVTSSLLIPFGLTIRDINVKMFINSPGENLDVFLTSPSGQRVELFTRVPGSKTGFGSSCSSQAESGPDFALDDQADNDLINGPKPLVGRYRSEGLTLGVFNGQNASGTWSLTLVDAAGAGRGRLECWCLEINSMVCILTPPGGTDSVGSDHTVTATIISDGVKVPDGVAVSFRITAGPNAGLIGTAMTVNGRASFTYTSNGLAGFDTIEASGSSNNRSFSCKANLSWSTDFLVQCSGDAPKTIRAGGVTKSAIIINNPMIISELKVKLFITHPNVAELRVSLVSPDGTTVQLLQGVGSRGASFGSTCRRGPDFMLDDGAVRGVDEGRAAFVGSFRPQSKLRSMYGENAAGRWQLFIQDQRPVTASPGRLECWCLEVVSASTRCELEPDFTLIQVGSVQRVTATVTVNGAPVLNAPVVFTIFGEDGFAAQAPQTTTGGGQAELVYARSVPSRDTILLRGRYKGENFFCSSIVDWQSGAISCELDTPTARNKALGTSHTVTATIRNVGVRAVPGVPLTFQVSSGPNAGEPSAVQTIFTDNNGQARFTYVSNGKFGEDTIIVRIGNQQLPCEARVAWDTGCAIEPPRVCQPGRARVMGMRVTVKNAGQPVVGARVSVQDILDQVVSEIFCGRRPAVTVTTDENGEAYFTFDYSCLFAPVPNRATLLATTQIEGVGVFFARGIVYIVPDFDQCPPDSTPPPPRVAFNQLFRTFPDFSEPAKDFSFTTRESFRLPYRGAD